MTGQGPPLEQYDYARTGRAAFFGFALHAPTSHVHYNFLEWMTVQGGFKGLQIPVFKTIMEQVRCFFLVCASCVVPPNALGVERLLVLFFWSGSLPMGHVYCYW